MPAGAPALLPEYVTTAQAAAVLGMSRKGLEQTRARGCGPPFVRVGNDPLPASDAGDAAMMHGPLVCSSFWTLRRKALIRLIIGAT